MSSKKNDIRKNNYIKIVNMKLLKRNTLLESDLSLLSEMEMLQIYGGDGDYTIRNNSCLLNFVAGCGVGSGNSGSSSGTGTSSSAGSSSGSGSGSGTSSSSNSGSSSSGGIGNGSANGSNIGLVCVGG